MRLRIMSAIICVLLILSACGNPSTALPTIPLEATSVPPNGTPTSNEAVTITLGVFDYDRANLEPILARFHDEHPTINIVITSLDDVLQTTPDKNGMYPPDSMTSMLRRIVSVADVAPSSWVTPEAYGTPLLRDIKPYMDADTAFERDDYYPSILDRYTVNGAQYLLPRTISIQAMAYNKDAFTAAQIPEPSREWSSSDLFAIAEKLTKVNNGTIERYGFYDNNGGSVVLLYLLAEAGVNVLDMSPRDLKVGDQKIIGALQKYADLVKRGVIFAQQQVAYGSNSANDYVDPSELIRNGKVAMWTDGSVYSPDGSPVQFTFDTQYTTLPHGPHEDINFYTEGYVMSGGTAHPNEAWTLMEWLSRQNLNPTAIGYAGYMAARQSLQAQMAPAGDENKARTDAYVYTISNLRPVTHFSGQDFSVYYTLSSATMGFFESPPKSAADIVANVVKNLNDSSVIAQQTPSPTPDIRPVTVATPEPDQAREGQKSITFAAYGTSMTDMRRLMRAFKKEDDSIFVKLISTDNLTTTQTISMAAARSDCFWWSAGLPVSAEDRAAIADIQPLIDNDANIQIDDVPVALLDVYRSDGRLLGFPHSYSTQALVYQDGLFAKLGIEAPQASWNRDDFLKAAKALTSNGTFGYSSMGNYIGDLLFWSNRFGGNFTTGSGTELRANFADPAVTDAIRWWLELATTQKVMPMPVFDYKRTGSSGYDQSYELQSQGKIGMWLDSGNGYAKQVVSDPNMPAPLFTTLMAPPPVGEKGLVASDLTMVGYHISATAGDPQACMSLIGFMSRQASTNLYGGIPARKSQSDSTIFAEQNAYSVPLRDAMATLLEQPITAGADTSNSNYIETYWLYQALDNATYRNADIGQELQKAQTKTNDFLACVATIDGSKKSPTYASCANKADPDYNGYMTDEAAR